MRAVLPAVTCTAQATYITGRMARDHGVVGNGWYHRDLAQVMFWRQPDELVRGDKIWDARAPPGLLVHVRQAVLVVQHVQRGGVVGHPAADLPRRRPEDSGDLLRARLAL